MSKQHNRVSQCPALAGWDCVAAAPLKPETVALLQAAANTCITTVTPTFKTRYHCRSITLVTGGVLIPQGKAHGQVGCLTSSSSLSSRLEVVHASCHDASCPLPCRVVTTACASCTSRHQSSHTIPLTPRRTARR